MRVVSLLLIVSSAAALLLTLQSLLKWDESRVSWIPRAPKEENARKTCGKEGGRAFGTL
jgi:hypothetical protein